MSHLDLPGSSGREADGTGSSSASASAADPTGAAALAARFDQGLSLRSAGGAGGTTSAPPPPGFRDSGSGRGAALNSVVGGGVRLQGFADGVPRPRGTGGPIGTRVSEERGGGLHERGSGAPLLRPSELAAHAADMGRSLSAPPEDMDGQGMRSSSFANLAAALGEDLAESMDDSLQKQQTLLNNILNGNGGGQHQQHLPR